MDNKTIKMNELIKQLNKASYAYYALDKPIMSDKIYDALYDELVALEEETGIILAGSPTQKVQGYVIDGFQKVAHSKPMLSAQKTKDINEINKFLEGHKNWYCSGKLDGCTLVVQYSDGKFVQGITRGNGIIGEDVTKACRFIKNLPTSIPWTEDLELRGECVMSWDEFNRINESLVEKYSHPRNLASGTLRQLDLNVIKERNLSFVVFECVTDIGDDSKRYCLDWLDSIGFETVIRGYYTDLSNGENLSSSEMVTLVSSGTEKAVGESKYPYDGLIFEIDSKTESSKLGATGHHENCRMALKWKDDEYETVLRDIEWQVGKSGQITPIGVFDTVYIDNVEINKASLSNISIMKKTLGEKPYYGQKIWVGRMNMVIPKIVKSIDEKGELHES